MKCLLSTLAALLLASSPASAGGRDDSMIRLARASGCLACHAIDPGAAGPAGLAPIGPSWREVAAKYKGRQDAAATLTRTVMAGSNPYDSHWKGQVSGLAMPPNAVAIRPPEARRLVRWILALERR